MIVDSGVLSGTSNRQWPFRRWELRSVPASARIFLLVVELAALAVTVRLLMTESMTASDWKRFAVLAVMALGYAEAGARVERLKRYLSPGGDKVVSNQASVWAFAAVLTLPAGWAGTLIALLYLQAMVQRSRDKTGVPYRVVFAGSTMILSAEAASAVLGAFGTGDPLRVGLLASAAVVLALVSFTLVNFWLLLGGMWLTRRPPSLRSLLPDTEAFSYEFATLVLGIVTAEFLVHTPALTPVAIILAAYLHRSSLVNSLHRAARTDTKTGLPNLTAWTQHAEAVLSHSQRHRQPVTVLFCDLDDFKAVNDTHGHLVGDQVLVAVAQTLRRELRGHDGIGRFGGDEFVVVLDSVDPAETQQIAARLRSAIGALEFDNDLRISVSLGIAHHAPDQVRPDLQELLREADSDLRTVKSSRPSQVQRATPDPRTLSR